MKMWIDPIVAEVRRVRLAIEKECDDDFAQIYARAIEVQKRTATKLVSRADIESMPVGETDLESPAHRKESSL